MKLVFAALEKTHKILPEGTWEFICHPIPLPQGTINC